MFYKKIPICKKTPKGKEGITDEQIRANNRDVPLMEEEETFFTDIEIDKCTVVPKEIFILFERRGAIDFTNNSILVNSVSNEKRNHYFS